MRTVFKLLNVFNCVDVLGVHLLEEERSIVCYEDPRHKKLVGFAAVALLVWAIVLPILQFTILFLRRVHIFNLINSGWTRKTLDD
jgi:hypothetical protein